MLLETTLAELRHMLAQDSTYLKAGLLATALLTTPSLIAAKDAESPRLILQITVDALRGDLPGRYAHLFGDGGFRYLMDEGIHYTNAHYQHANTETIVGHVSLATGTVPAAHGMLGNVWFDREEGGSPTTSRTRTIIS
jgi:hypothetical protein